MRWSGATGAIARCKRVSTECGRRHRSVPAWPWICGVKPTPKAVNTPSPHSIVHGLDKPGVFTTVSMNSHLSDVDTLTQDDRDGAVFLYPQPSRTASVQASSGSGSGGGCTLYLGIDVDLTLGGVLLLLAVCRIWIRTRRAYACGRGTSRRLERGRRQAKTHPAGLSLILL